MVWEGYRQSTRCTYLLDLNPDLIEANYSAGRRGDIKKANNCHLRVVKTHDCTDLLRLYNKLCSRKNIKKIASDSFIRSVIETATASKFGMVFNVIKGDAVCSAGLLVWDKTTAYYLVGAYDQAYSKLGSGSFLLNSMINFAKLELNCRWFDFEGSMDKGIEEYFRSFGGKQVIYNTYIKYRSIVASLIYNISIK